MSIYIHAKFAKGNPSHPLNPMGYSLVRLNLPGMVSNNSNKPKVMKWNSVDDCLAGDVITFVDDA